MHHEPNSDNKNNAQSKKPTVPGAKQSSTRRETKQAYDDLAAFLLKEYRKKQSTKDL